MSRIRIIDKGADTRHYDFEYTVPDAARTFLTGHYPVAGKIGAFMCNMCGRILMFAEATE
jgi:hypothetical protein